MEGAMFYYADLPNWLIWVPVSYGMYHLVCLFIELRRAWESCR